MTVNTLRVPGRRRLRFRNYGEVRADIDRLRAAPHRALGNWSLARIVMHLGQTMHGSIEGPSFDFPWPARLLGRLVKPYVLYVGVPSGIKLPRAGQRAYFIETEDLGAALARFDSGVERLARDSNRLPHPLMGRLTPAEWDCFHLRHSENHLRFLVPD